MSNQTQATNAIGFAVKPLVWSENQNPNSECPYHHCTAQTPFGSFLLTWKGFKKYYFVTADETPWNEWFGSWDSVEMAKSACQAEYSRRVLVCLVTKNDESQVDCDLQILEIQTKKRRGNIITETSPIKFGGCPFCGSQSCVDGECRHNGKTPLIPDMKK
jgi:hypothetical protein